MKIRKLKAMLITVCCFVTAFLSESHGMDVRQNLNPIGLPIANLAIRDPLPLPPFADIRRYYESPNHQEKKIGRVLLKVIAENNNNENQIEALRILMRSPIGKDSLFSKNIIFNIILCPDAYDEEKIINVSQILLINYNHNPHAFYNPNPSSNQLVGARKLLEIGYVFPNPPYKYESASLLYRSRLGYDQQRALQFYRLVCERQEEEIDRQFEAANVLYPLMHRPIDGLPIPAGLPQQIQDADRAIARNVYRTISDREIVFNEPIQVRIPYNITEVRRFPDNLNEQPLSARELVRLYNIAESFLLENQNDVERSLNNFVRISGHYQNYIPAAYKSCHNLADYNFNQYVQAILPVYRHVFDNLNPNQFYINILNERDLRAINFLLQSNDDNDKRTALRSYFHRLICIENERCQDGARIYTTDGSIENVPNSGVCEIQETLVRQGNILFLNIGGFQRRADIAALDNIYWLMYYVNNARTPGGALKIAPNQRENFRLRYIALFDNPILRPNDQEFTQLYNRVRNRVFGIEQPNPPNVFNIAPQFELEEWRINN